MKQYSFLIESKILHEIDVKTAAQALRRAGATKQQFVDMLNSGGRFVPTVDGHSLTKNAAPTVWNKFLSFLKSSSAKRLEKKAAADASAVRGAIETASRAEGELTGATKKAMRGMKKAARSANPEVKVSDTAKGFRKQIAAARAASNAAGEEARQLQVKIDDAIKQLEQIKGSIPEQGRLGAEQRTQIIDKLLAKLRDRNLPASEKEVVLASIDKTMAKYQASMRAAAADAAAASQPTRLRGAVAKSNRNLERTATRLEPQYGSAEFKANGLEEYDGPKKSLWSRIAGIFGS